ncbi:MAG TPA: cytosine permease [Thermoplasmata archaeon]|nr:cytosine permease [Thermoplasmata archaeon]
MLGSWLRKPAEWGVDPVPQDQRRLRAIDLGVLWFSLGVGLLVLFAGALLVFLGLSLFEVLWVSILGSVIGSLMLAAAGLTGSRHGVPTMVSLRPVLGRKASWIPSGINSLQLVGWASFEFMIMGIALSLVSGPLLGSATVYVWIAVLAVWVTLLALGGPLLVIRKWLERFAVWLVVASTIWLTYLVVTHPGFLTNFFAVPSAGTRNLGVGLDLVIAMPISWWPLVSDYNRFARRPRDSFAGTFLGYTLSNSWFYFLGAAILVVFGLADQSAGPVAFVQAIVGTVLGSLVLLLIIVDETDNAFANVYSTAVSAQNIAPRASQRRLVIGTALIAFVVGSAIASEWQVFAALYEGFLLFVGGVFVPLLGVLIADQWVRQRYEAAEFADRAPAVKGIALVSWIFGIATYVSVNGIGLVGTENVLMGPLWASPVGASLPAFFVAGGLHAVLSRTASFLAARHAPVSGGGNP